MGKLAKWKERLALCYHSWRSEHQPVRERLGLAQPVYVPGFVPPRPRWHYAVGGLGLLAAILVILLLALGSGGQTTSDEDGDRPSVAEQTTTPASQMTTEPSKPAESTTTNPPVVEPPQPEPATPANHTNADYRNLPRCTVTKISDGDTFYVDCLSQRIRLIGVDTPESTNKHQCYGNEASVHTRGLLGQAVYLETDDVSGDTDTYGRYLRYVYLDDGTNYNMQLIEDGFGMNYVFNSQHTKYGDLFKRAEDEARGAGRGLWDACQTGINRYGNYQVVN